MRLYRIDRRLQPVDELPKAGEGQYVAIVTRAEWAEHAEDFQMGIDLELDLDHPLATMAEVNVSALTGSFSIPDRAHPQWGDYTFAFAMDGRGVVLIDDDDSAARFVDPIAQKKQWNIPSLERFLYDMLESIVDKDLPMLEDVERRLSGMEEDILAGDEGNILEAVSRIRGDLLALRTHYEQLLDLGQELNENENDFFEEKNLRYFDMFCARIMRLQDYVTTLREYSVQVRDLYQSQLSERQNNIVTLLTVATVVFTPLTLITGWYGMNFKYMPELEWPVSYPVVALVCVLIAVVCIVYFKKKKWM